MMNNRQKGMATRYVEPMGGRMEAPQATEDHSENMASSSGTNWAWGNGRLGYDWMDSHYLPTDFA